MAVAPKLVFEKGQYLTNGTRLVEVIDPGEGDEAVIIEDVGEETIETKAREQLSTWRVVDPGKSSG